MRIIDGFQVSRMDTGVFVAEPVTEEAIGVFPNKIQMGLSGAFLWDLLTEEGQQYTREQLVDKLGNMYENGTSMENLSRDVDVFLNFLRDNSLLIEED